MAVGRPGAVVSQTVDVTGRYRARVVYGAPVGLWLVGGDDVQDAQAGTWVHMPANLKHSIRAKTPVVMLLVLLK